jgi:microcystin degradation protein MlrC
MAASKAYILSNLWDTTLSGAAWDEPCVFNRTIAGPVDKFSIFPSLSSAE